MSIAPERPAGRRSPETPRRLWTWLMTVLPSLSALVLFGARPAGAHPVSQGALEIVLFPDRVAVRARVSIEEVLVATASGPEAASHLEAVRGYGDYLLAHLHVTADGRPLAGCVISRPERAGGRPSYELEYGFIGGAPARLVIREDVLREVEFAPGTPWEASYLVRISRRGQPAVEGLLTCRQPLEFECHWRLGSTVEAPGVGGTPDRSRAVIGFVRHGIQHILTGYDHLLFVGALLLAVAGLWDLIKVITAFTLAHTLTLTVSALDVFRLPEGIVEPLIAASIVVVALQNVFWPEHCRGRGRLLVTFCFGLFHGLGFAGGLLDAMSGLSAAGAVEAIVAFSAGVEIGHQMVVLPAFGGLSLLRRVGLGTSDRDQFVRRYGSAVISLLGMFYLVVAIR